MTVMKATLFLMLVLQTAADRSADIDLHFQDVGQAKLLDDDGFPVALYNASLLQDPFLVYTAPADNTPAEDPRCPPSKCLTVEAANKFCYKKRHEESIGRDTYRWTLLSEGGGQILCKGCGGSDYSGHTACNPKCDKRCHVAEPQGWEQLQQWVGFKTKVCYYDGSNGLSSGRGWSYKWQHSHSVGELEQFCGGCGREFCSPTCLKTCMTVDRTPMCKTRYRGLNGDSWGPKYELKEEYKLACGACSGSCDHGFSSR